MIDKELVIYDHDEINDCIALVTMTYDAVLTDDDIPFLQYLIEQEFDIRPPQCLIKRLLSYMPF